MKKLLIILMVLVLTGCNSTSNLEPIVYQTINQTEAQEKLDNENAILIDVRTKEEYKQGNIKNSINIPLNEIETIDYEKDTVLIVYCRSGGRSKNAANILINNGYTKVYDLGSIDNWIE